MNGQMEPDTGAPQPPRDKSVPVEDESLRGTRFEFGGRRPYSFVPPRPAYRPSGRPLPGVGTVALGKVSRTTQYGAFVDFLGFRGLVHISQLVPGMRVERVEDVVNVGDEVRVRVIAVDPERRHINLALDPLSAERPAIAVSGTGLVGESGTSVRGIAGEGVPPNSVGMSAQQRVEEQPDAARPSVDTKDVDHQLDASPPVPEAPSSVQPVETQAELAAPPQRTPALPDVRSGHSAKEAMPVASAPPRGASKQAPPPVSARPTSQMARPGTIQSNRPPAPGQTKPAKPAQPEVARHGARAVRREYEDPTHPMARLLSAARGLATPPVPKERSRVEQQTEEQAPAPVAPKPPRPIHVAEPEPETETEQPATLEALAARFGQRRERPSKSGPASPRSGSDRSRQEREKQAAILEKMRRGR